MTRIKMNFLDIYKSNSICSLLYMYIHVYSIQDFQHTNLERNYSPGDDNDGSITEAEGKRPIKPG